MGWTWLIHAGIALYYMIRDIPNEKKYFGHTVPQQLVELVRQAHQGASFSTEWNISVGADMREKLCYPLTPEQVEIIRQTKCYTSPDQYFVYTLQSYKFNDDELSGVVLVTIRYRDEGGKLDLDYRDIPIRLRCGGKPGNGWELLEVEYL